MKRGNGKMIKKILKRIKARKNQQTEEKICWPCNWSFQDVQNFNAMLYGMALEKMQ